MAAPSPTTRHTAERSAEAPPAAATASAAWAARTGSDAVAQLGTRSTGLTGDEVTAHRASAGANAIPPHRANALAVLGRQFRNTVLLLLLGTAIVAGLLGDLTDAVIISVILLASIVLGFANEYAAERATARLQDSLTHSAVVVRDGTSVSVPVTDVVPGDIVELSLGCRVPADLRLLTVSGLSCDESMLSGESLPSDKSIAPVTGTAVSDLDSMAFMGTIVRAGSATGVAVATGEATEIGRLAAGLDRRMPETSFQLGLRRFSLLLVWVAVALVAIVLFTGVLLGRPFIESVLFALAIAVGVTPQLLPAVVNTSLAAGARRLAKHKVLVKRLVCIEDLGNIQVLITDKTGTLTIGSMTFEHGLDPAGADAPELVGLAARTVTDAGAGSGTTDALDAALVAAAGPVTGAAPGTPSSVLADLPFDHERRMASALVALSDGPTLITKGAPESVLARCVDVPSAAAAVAQRELDRGGRLIAVASKAMPGATALESGDESGLRLRGFLVFNDPPRAEARASLQRLSELGIRLVIATGDHPAVASEVARSLGMEVGTPLTGEQIDALDDRQLAAALDDSSIVARVSPEQKERVVSVLRAAGQTTGFLGDGVNDSLALHSADVGISVDTATDVAKDAADIVLLEKSLDVIADGVAEGRRIFANTLKYVFMAASGNFGNMISAAVASAFLPFLPMLPGQILLGNLLYDASQLTISSDRVDSTAVRAPAHWDIGAIGRFMLVFGPLSSIFDLATFALLTGAFHAGATQFRTGWFIESLVSQTLVVLVIRTRRYPFVRSRPGIALLAALLAVVAIAIALPYSPLGPVLGFETPDAGLLLAIAGVVVAYLVIADLAKFLFFREEGRRKPPHPRLGRLRRAIGPFAR
ncbi:magnesium-translocating P-type ATPase [Lysinimonas soli]|uniref:Magnesium-transporting ATPase, P-type 1 n=1 Tax=Lysinimonas soli TaxID=1074233 RepID=A0ABW0NTB6_9MICO